MESTADESHDDLVLKLTTGFGAMLEEVQELARTNSALVQQVNQANREVRLLVADFETR